MSKKTKQVKACEVFNQVLGRFELDNSMGDFNNWIFDFIDMNQMTSAFGDYVRDKAMRDIGVECFECGWQGCLHDAVSEDDCFVCPECDTLMVDWI